MDATLEFLNEIKSRKGEQYILFRAFTIRLLSTRREFAPLIRLSNELNNLWDRTLSVDLMQKKIIELRKDWETANKNAVNHAIDVLKDCSRVLIHSHSGTVTKVISEVRPSEVVCTESYPGFEGYNQIQTLSELGIRTHLVVDTAVSVVIPKIDCVLLGCDAITTTGVFNKVGSFLIAVSSREFGKPVYVVTTSHRFLPESLHALFYQGESSHTPRKKVRVERYIAPLLELIPWKYISSTIIESGNYSPDEILEKIEGIRVHPVINAVLPEISHAEQE